MPWKGPAISAGAGVVSSGLGSMLGASQERSRRRRARRAIGSAVDGHRERHDGYTDERRELLDDAFDTHPVMRGDLGDALADNESAFIANLEANEGDRPQTTGNFSRAGSSAGGRAMEAALNSEREANTAERDQRRGAMATMNSLGSVLQGANRARAPIARRIGQADRFQRRHAQELPAEVNAIMERYQQDVPSLGQNLLQMGLQGVGSGLMQSGGQQLGKWWES